MSARDCQRADIWMAAVDAGQLDEASRIRLLDHLESCPACARRAHGIAQLVTLLREAPAEPRNLQQLWARTLAAQTAAREPARDPRRRIRLGLGLAAGIAAATLAVGWIWLRAPRPGSPAPQLANRASSLRASWRAVSLVEARIAGTRESGDGGPVEGDRLVVRRGGRAVLASASEVVVIREESELLFARATDGTPTLELLRGALLAQTRDRGPRRAFLVRAGGLSLRPLGTAFSVRWSDRAIETLVLDGRVEISRPEGPRVVVLAGQGLRWGSQVRPLEDRERRELERELGQGQAVAAGREALPESAPPRPIAEPRGPDASAPESRAAPEVRDELRAIERMLARGQTARARSRAEQLLARGPTPGQAPTLRTLIAESYLRERRYREARDSYLRVFTQSPRTPIGADGLYMVGSLELEQLGEPAQARRRFERYLQGYPRGRQREGAHYLLCRALLKSGETALARAAAARYLAEFPNGQLRSTLERIASPPAAPRP